MGRRVPPGPGRPPNASGTMQLLYAWGGRALSACNERAYNAMTRYATSATRLAIAVTLKAMHQS